MLEKFQLFFIGMSIHTFQMVLFSTLIEASVNFVILTFGLCLWEKTWGMISFEI